MPRNRNRSARLLESSSVSMVHSGSAGGECLRREGFGRVYVSMSRRTVELPRCHSIDRGTDPPWYLRGEPYLTVTSVPRDDGRPISSTAGSPFAVSSS